MRILKSSVVALFIFFAFALHYSKQIKIVSEQETSCVCSYDGFGYYMYLPFFAEHGHLKMTHDWAQNLQNEYCGGTFVYQIVKSEATNNQEVDVYHMGQAFVELPGFLVGHLSAKALGYKTDGFSKPYHIAFLLNSLLFIAIGIYYFRKVMLLFFSDQLSALLLLFCFAGTNYWIMATLSPTMTHHYLFAVIGGFTYFFFKSIRGYTIHKRAFILSCVFFGLAVVIRPTHALLGIIPGIILVQRFGWSKQFWKLILWYPALAIIWNLPQIYYWKTAADEWFITNLHTEDLTLFDPYTWKFLFSYRKGWLLYTPLFLLLIPAFIHLFRKNRKYFYAFGLFTAVSIWVISSWECWWYSDSLSQRPMVDIYSLLFLPIGFFLCSLKTNLSRGIVGTFATCCILLNMFQSYQMDRGILHTDRMSKEQYWHVWGKTDRDTSDYRLSIPRGDTLWPIEVEAANDPNVFVRRSIWLQLKNLTAKPNSNLDIKHLPYSELETDEVLITVNITFSASDTLNSSYLKLESAGRHNCYSWETIPLHASKADTTVSIQKSFNIPDVRHAKDYLQVYVINPTITTFKMKELKISTTRLIRK